MLCCATLYYVVLICPMLCYVVLICNTLYDVVIRCTMLHYGVVVCTMVCYVVLRWYITRHAKRVFRDYSKDNVQVLSRVRGEHTNSVPRAIQNHEHEAMRIKQWCIACDVLQTCSHGDSSIAYPSRPPATMKS